MPEAQLLTKTPSKITALGEAGDVAMRVPIALVDCVTLNTYTIDYCTDASGNEIIRTGGINDGCVGGYHTNTFSVLTISIDCILGGGGGPGGINNPPIINFPPGNTVPPVQPGNGAGGTGVITTPDPNPVHSPSFVDENGNPIITTPILGSVIKKFVKSLTETQLIWWNNVNNNDEVVQIKEYIWLCSVSGASDIETNEIVKRILDYLILNPFLTWNDVYNNRTNLDIDQVETNNYRDGGHDNTTYEDFDEDGIWPTIDPIISKEDFVGWGSPGIRRNCMDYAKAQIAKVGYQISNYYAANQTFQIYTSQNGVNEDELAKGLSYLVYALSNGIPVIVGVDDAPGNPGNLDNTTDHFVVIVGMGTDSNGKYFLFYDNASGKTSKGTSILNKLYYNSTTKTISGTSQTEYAQGQPLPYTVTMIRKSKQL